MKILDENRKFIFSLSYEAAQMIGKLELGQGLKPRKKKIVTLINVHTSNP